MTVNGETRTFADGDGITFPKNMGGKRRFTVDRVEFAGYGLDAPGAGHMDFRGKDVKDAAVVWLGAERSEEHRSGVSTAACSADATATRPSSSARRRASGRSSETGAGRAGGAGQAGAQDRQERQDRREADGARRCRPPTSPPCSGSTRRTPPNVTANDAFFTFLFSQAPAKYDELKRKAAAQEELPSFRVPARRSPSTSTPTIRSSARSSRKNVVGIVEGSDPQLKSTYVAFGAHYDHVGYAEGEVTRGDGGARRAGAPGRVTPGAEDDRIWNGADDDGSGTVAIMALAKAFAEGPKPKRSLIFVWHAGEERGLWGSRYFADYPTVPIDKIVAQLNIDMIGRNRDDKASEANTVYLVGSDRISTELHALNRAANAAMPKPLTLNYEFNDPTDLEQLYYRSDHYSYAAKGIPIIFFTTGLHPDYHANTDEVSKIEFDKMTRITQMVYETGARLANLDHAPVRDNKGPRAGRLDAVCYCALEAGRRIFAQRSWAGLRAEILRLEERPDFDVAVRRGAGWGSA